MNLIIDYGDSSHKCYLSDEEGDYDFNKPNYVRLPNILDTSKNGIHVLLTQKQ